MHYNILSIRLENIANQSARKRRNKAIIALLPVFGKLKRNLEKTPTVHFVSKKQASLIVPRVYFYRVFNSTYLVTVGDLYQKMSHNYLKLSFSTVNQNQTTIQTELFEI